MSRILITGSQGTLGKVLRRELETRGHEVFGCDLKHSANPNEMRADVANASQLNRAFMKADPQFVYHLAAEFGRMNGEEYSEQLWRHNCLGTRNVIDSCIDHEAKLIFASSSEAYGEFDRPRDAGLREDFLDRSAPTFHNEYALSKWTNERQVNIAAVNRGLDAVILRFFNAYGPGEYYTPYRSVVCLFIYKLLNGLPITVYKNYHRVFMYVDDWARTVANAVSMTSEKRCKIRGHMYHNGICPIHSDAQCLSPGRQIETASRPTALRAVPVYNVGGEEYCSVEELKDKIVSFLGGSLSEIRYLEKEAANVTNKRPNIEAARLDLMHNPSTTLDTGLPLTIAWMLDEYKIDRHKLTLEIAKRA